MMRRLPEGDTRFRLAALVAIGALCQTPNAYARTGPDARPPTDTIVISESPLDAGVSPDRIPAGAATLDADDLSRSGKADLLGALDARLGGVSLVQAQANPFQPNLLYRGFEASPLAGDPQGLAVYLDGSRFNQSFGDTVDWDLVPDIAISRVDLVAANPAFGLNALGGAVGVTLKNAFSDPGGAIEVSSGSFNRREASLASGQRFGPFGVFFAGTGLDEDGWRDVSPSRLRQGYADLGWRSGRGEIHVGLLGADNTLTGNGVSPVQLLAADRSAVFTHPDTTHNEFQRLSLGGDWALSNAWTLRVRGYRGWLTRNTVNGDAAEAAPCDGDNNFVCPEDSSDPLTDISGNPVPNFILGSPYAAAFPEFGAGGPYALLNHTRTRTLSWGVSGQITRAADLFGKRQRLAIGLSLDQSSTRFAAGSTLGALTLDRGWAGPGVELDTPDAAITPVSVHVGSNYWGLFASDAIDLAPRLTLTLTGRANFARVSLRDQIGAALNGTHTFRRFNPGAGLTWRAGGGVTAYVSYSETNRAPTPAELSCADETAPCSLANFFVADPPLKQVVAHTSETGLRGAHRIGGDIDLSWRLGAYRTNVSDDIQIVASSVPGRGYFVNVGRTRRQGIEAGIAANTDRLSIFADYAWSDATYQTPFDLNAGANPVFGDEDDIMAVGRGNHRPGIPAHNFKFGIDYDVFPSLRLGLDATASSGRYLLGDEANLNPKTGGYVVVNLHAVQRIGSRFEIFAQVDNLLDEDYETFGAFSPAEAVPIAGFGNLDNPRSLSPGAPRAVHAGLRVNF